MLSLRGGQAIQYVSNSELRRLGRQVVESVEASRAAQANTAAEKAESVDEQAQRSEARVS